MTPIHALELVVAGIALPLYLQLELGLFIVRGHW